MKKILILTSHFLPNPSANGINTKYIVDELKKRGHSVTCISLKRPGEKAFEIIDDIPIYRISPSIYSRILNKESNSPKNIFNKMFFKIWRIFRKIKLAIFLYKFPNNDVLQVDKIYKLLSLLHEKEKFDCVIGVFKPYTNIAAIMKFKNKNKNKNIVCGAYYLDLINSSRRPSFMPRWLYKKLCYKGDINAFKELDFVLLAKGGKSIYDGREYDSIRDKIDYIDFPTFHILPSLEVTPEYKSSIVLTYAGTLDREYRNPRYLLECLKEINLDITLNIYGKGNCDDILNGYKDVKHLRIINHGMVLQDVVRSSMLRSDFLINISNTIQNAVPSKIFEMFATGKPIINLCFSKSDITEQYFKKYPSVLTLNTWENIDIQKPDLIEFLKKEKGKVYNTTDIKKDFIENTPEHTVDIIERRINAFD
ncbi:hypothetical protein ACFYKT_17435 [Cytobacillus sp. FJAT-53684]|uniref:Glycosyltransferase subfamily 4-like N-terminal domain-containing protein n=1 Tax=Cytobacillus mangrovibacter TaxID=3299024 RepID=A0ABW6K1T1_9BACI